MKRKITTAFFLVIAVLMGFKASAQTEQDAIMMGKGSLCIATMYSYNSWSNYWEGTFKRDNANMGTFSTNVGMFMLNYGLTKNLNMMASLPYVSNKVSLGTLGGLKGFQDASAYLKWRAVKKEFGKQSLSLFATGGFSAPTHSYNVDFMPLCIGMGSKVLAGRLIADYQRSKFFATASGAYLYRSNVNLDRDAYYTDRQVNSSEVKMPDAGSFQFRTGYRSRFLIAETFVDNMTTFGGFDIRKNDMPFISNKMNSTRVGIESKYYYQKHPALELHANVWHTVAGRNVGQATGYMLGLAYVVNFKPHSNQ